jgi:hypothetical protein
MNDPISNIISKIGLQSFIDESEGYSIIQNTSTFLLTNKSLITAFRKVLKRPQFLDELFSIEQINQRNTVNGDIATISVKESPHISSPKLLIKLPKLQTSDPLSIEYYIGLTLNEIRLVPEFVSFAFLYGITKCHNDIRKGLIYNKNPLKDSIPSSIIFYEYLTVDDKPLSLADWIGTFNPLDKESLIEFEDTLVSIVRYLMCSLQYAYTKYRFTHYDLHLNNIMLQEIPRPTEFTFRFSPTLSKTVILKRFIPIIIDFGRSYIDPNEVIQPQITDLLSNKQYTSFKEMMNALWKGRTFYHSNKGIIDAVKLHIRHLREDPSLNFYKLTEKEILTHFYGLKKSEDQKEYVYSGINPLTSHPTFDTFRLIKSICAMLTSASKVQLNPIWYKLNTLLSQNYPIYVPRYFELPRKYDPYPSQFDYYIKYPIDIIEFIDIYYNFPKTMQIGGNDGSLEHKVTIEIKLEQDIIDHMTRNKKHPLKTIQQGSGPFNGSISDNFVINDKPNFEKTFFKK